MKIGIAAPGVSALQSSQGFVRDPNTFSLSGQVFFEPAPHVFFFPQNLLAYKLRFGVSEGLRGCN
jgi:hypothetical protein